MARRLGVALALALLAACGPKAPEGDPGPPERQATWEGLPGPVFVVSRDLPKCTKAATAAAFSWWQYHLEGDLDVVWAEPNDPAILIVPQGVVAMTNAPPLLPERLATTIVYFSADGSKMHSAEMQLGGTCEPKVVAHEIGHALGWVQHAPGPGWLMSAAFPNMTWRHPE